MISRLLLTGVSVMIVAAAVQAQNARPPANTGAPPTTAAPGLAGGDLSPLGYRDPVYRTGGDILRATVADGFTFAAGGDLLGPANPLSQLGDPEINKMLKLLQDADVG